MGQLWVVGQLWDDGMQVGGGTGAVGWCWAVFVGGVGSCPACLGPHLPGLLLCPQVLDGLLAQYGTVENVEQGKMDQRDPHPCKIPSAALQLCSGCRKLTGMNLVTPVALV